MYVYELHKFQNDTPGVTGPRLMPVRSQLSPCIRSCICMWKAAQEAPIGLATLGASGYPANLTSQSACTAQVHIVSSYFCQQPAKSYGAPSEKEATMLCGQRTRRGKNETLVTPR